MNEHLRLSVLEHIAVAAAATADWTLTYGFPENAGVPRRLMLLVWPIMGLVGSECIDCAGSQSIKSQLREIRTSRGWSQAELADRLDVSRRTISAIETERHDPRLPLAFVIARLFKLRIEDIFSD